ncbi:hypothetical protein LJR269_006665 [Duganella sp. LjRoot269]
MKIPSRFSDKKATDRIGAAVANSMQLSVSETGKGCAAIPSRQSSPDIGKARVGDARLKIAREKGFPQAAS